MNRMEFTDRVLRMEQRLYRIAYGILRNEQDRLDAVQESLLKAWKNLDSLRYEKFFETWLTRILIRECYNICRAKKNIVPIENAKEPTEPPQGADAVLHDALLALDRELRIPLILNYIEGYKVREIAKILDLPEGTVKTRLKRAKARLKQMLMDPEEE